MDNLLLNVPSYQDLVKFNDEEFKKWLFVFENSEHRNSILEQMIDFEEVNDNISKVLANSEKIPDEVTIAVFNLFKRGESVSSLKFLDKLGKETGKDLVLNAILAKVATDRTWFFK